MNEQNQALFHSNEVVLTKARAGDQWVILARSREKGEVAKLVYMEGLEPRVLFEAGDPYYLKIMLGMASDQCNQLHYL